MKHPAYKAFFSNLPRPGENGSIDIDKAKMGLIACMRAVNDLRGLAIEDANVSILRDVHTMQEELKFAAQAIGKLAAQQKKLFVPNEVFS